MSARTEPTDATTEGALESGTRKRSLAETAPNPGDLTALQLWMVELLRHGRTLERDDSVARAAAVHFAGNDRLSPAQQIEIYREQFWLRHTSALLEDFPGLSGILGQEDWQRLAETYLGDHVPRSFTLRDLGAGMAAHVATSTWLSHHRLCTDMVHLEWAYLEAFDCEEVAPLDPDALSVIPDDAWESARLEFCPSVHLLDLGYPVNDLRRSLRRARDTEEAVPIPEPRPTRLVVYRKDRGLFDKELASEPFALLSALVSGATLLEACERTLALHPDAEALLGENLGGWFQTWGRLGWITGVDTGAIQNTSKG